MTRDEQILSHYIGVRVRMVRESKGLSQAKLAKQIQISSQQMQKHESGTNRISAARLLLISQILETPIMSFLPIPKFST